MTQNPVLEGTWEEIAQRAYTLPAGQRYRLIPVTPIQNASTESNASEVSAEGEKVFGMQEALELIAERQKGRPSISGSDTEAMLRRARSGGLYGLEPTE